MRNQQPVPTRAQIKGSYVAKGYPFSDQPGVANIFGIRSNNTDPDVWDDLLGIAYIGTNSAEQLLMYWGTTHPGLPWLLKPMQKRGAAVILPGFYPNVWNIGLHQGKIPALKQVGNFKICRENTDGIFDPNYDRYEVVGVGTGLNCHPTYGRAAKQWRVGLWSAGCQVPNLDVNSPAWGQWMDVCRASARTNRKGTLSYALFTEDDLV